MRAVYLPESMGILISLLLINLAVWLFFLPRRCSGRHTRYQQQALRVLAKLPQLAGDGQRLSYLRKINPYVFEELLLTAFERRGYRIQRNPRYSGDGGLDGQVWQGEQRYLVQAKRYARHVHAAHIAAFGRLVRSEHCRGYFIHTGRTGAGCRAELKRFPEVELLSGQTLLALLHPGENHE